MYESLIAFVPIPTQTFLHWAAVDTIHCTYREPLFPPLQVPTSVERYAPVSVASLLCLATDNLLDVLFLLTDTELIEVINRFHAMQMDPPSTL